jgi:molecular chaperone Hsp33
LKDYNQRTFPATVYAMTESDCLRRFLFDDLGVRGEWVQLTDSWQQAKQHQTGLDSTVKSQLGQALAAVVLLSATIKYHGNLIMQLQGGGQLKALVAQASHDRAIRGLARHESEVSANNLQGLIGEGGRLVLTIESDNAEPYQGIVAVDQPSLAQVVENYFNQSEQLATRLWLFANDTHAAGLLLQALPTATPHEDDWDRVTLLANTVSAEELLTLDCETLLHRLFNQEKVAVFAAEAVRFECGCSRTKISNTLAALGRAELQSILSEMGKITVDCQFCAAQYCFDPIDVEQLLLQPTASADAPSSTQH